MIRKYSLLIEGDESGYSAHIPELPATLVTGRSVKSRFQLDEAQSSLPREWRAHDVTQILQEGFHGCARGLDESEAVRLESEEAGRLLAAARLLGQLQSIGF
jgi:hypothetical protein